MPYRPLLVETCQMLPVGEYILSLAFQRHLKQASSSHSTSAKHVFTSAILILVLFGAMPQVSHFLSRR